MKYQVLLYSCPASAPFIFAKHTWFVINNAGKISRWEVGFQSNAANTNWNHLYKNFLPPDSGIGILPYGRKYLWNSNLLGSIEGDEGSAAQRMVEFIENSPKTYPFCHRYSLPGPNSNTYIQWILNHFPEFQVKLPWNAIGKNYRF